MTKNSFACFLMGLGTGMGLALLYAPESGEQVRERIKVKKDEAMESLKKGGGALKDMATDMGGKAQEAVNRATDALTETVADGKQAIDEARGA
jgi:gas vesicle protein